MKEIAFYFIIYAFGGWILENIYSLLTTGVFLKPNFLRSPLKPMYGIAPVLLIYLTYYVNHWAFVLAIGLVIPTTVEYITGVFLEKYSGRKWWDYTELPGQIQGHICVSFCLCWIFLSFGLIYFLHPFVTDLYQGGAHLFDLFIPFLSIGIILDMAISTIIQKANYISFPIKF